jgi:hypothetical protein
MLINQNNNTSVQIDNLRFPLIPTISNYIIGKDSMIIFDYGNDDIIIPEHVKNLIIGSMNVHIDNLPINLEFLEIGFINCKLPLNNLPIGLKKLTICNDEAQYYNELNKDYIITKITESDIKLPFGCELNICLNDDII